MSFSRKTLPLILAVVGVALSAGAASATIDPSWQSRWTEDLRYAQHEAEEKHPNLFHALSRDAWNAEFDSLIARLPTLEHHQVVVELARIVARLQEGHSRLTIPLGPGIEFEQGHATTAEPKLESLRFHQYPIRFMVGPGGVYVRRIAAGHREILGARVVKLGDLAMDDAVAAVKPVIRHDNSMEITQHLPMFLSLAEVLQARGVTASTDRLAIEVDEANGRTSKIVLDAVPFGDEVQWVDARDGAPVDTPLYLRNNDRNFWFEHLPETHTVYLQFNVVYDQEDETLRDFAARLERFLAERDVRHLVIDLRHNRGGDQSLAIPLLRTVIRSDADRTGDLYALVGRTTFSAAMMFSLEMEKFTHVLFAGEPTGARPNSYGDSRRIVLPNTGLTLRLSSLYWQNDPTDSRDAITPPIPVALSMADVRANRDPVLDTVLGIIAAREQSRGALEGAWQGMVSPGLNDLDMSLDVAAGPKISVRVPAMGLDAQASDVQIDGRTLEFRVDWQNEPIRFVGEADGDWMIGEGDYKSVRFPFAVKIKTK